MKPFYLLLLIPFITACSPEPMNDATAKAYKECMAKGWVPTYFSNGAKIKLECKPHQKLIPMSEETKQAFQQCLTKSETNAVYTAKSGSVSCTGKGANVRVR